jgi:membrane protease subunit HflC
MRAIVIVLAAAVLLGLATAAYTVGETQQVVLTQFGRPVGEPITTPGLHFRIPLIQKIHRFDKRFLEWDGDANELPTRDKRFIWVDTYARWRITAPLLFYQRLRDERGAQTRLDDILDGETRNAIAKHQLVELIRSTNRKPEAEETQPTDEEAFPQIQYGREKIRQEILASAQQRTSDLGIEILDLQFKRINYVEEVRKKVYDRMIAERQRIADRYRSEGEGEASRIQGKRERELKRIQSEAYRRAQEIIGDADAKATDIYAAAYNQSADSRRFYSFLKAMETLPKTISDDTTVVLSTRGELYEHLQEAGR